MGYSEIKILDKKVKAAFGLESPHVKQKHKKVQATLPFLSEI